MYNIKKINIQLINPKGVAVIIANSESVSLSGEEIKSVNDSPQIRALEKEGKIRIIKSPT